MGVSGQKIRSLLLVTGVFLLLGSLIGLFWLNHKLRQMKDQSPSLPVLVQLPTFSLTERSRQLIGLDDLKGSIWIADFIFTRCPGPCPLMSARMSKLQETFKDVPSLKLVSITVDPEFDTCQVLSEYADVFQAQKGRWFFLTGERTRIHELAKAGFRVGGVEDVSLHSTRFILVDQEGRVRGYYDSQDDQEIQKLIHDAKILLRGVKS